MATTAPGMVLFSISRFSAAAISASLREDMPTDSGLALGRGSPCCARAGESSAKAATKIHGIHLVIVFTLHAGNFRISDMAEPRPFANHAHDDFGSPAFLRPPSSQPASPAVQ